MTDRSVTPDLATVPSGSYDFLPLDKVAFGPGSASTLDEEISRLGCSHPFFITLGPTGERVMWELRTPTSGHQSVSDEWWPTESSVSRVVSALESSSADVIVTVGGAGAVEMAKASILAVARDTGRFLAHIALPTGPTGQEFSPLVSLRDERTGAWTGTSNPFVTPSLVILDAQLTEDTPDEEWLSGAALAVQHAVEVVYAPNHQPATDATALEALRILSRYGEDSVRHGSQRTLARQQCLLAAWLAAAGVANITLGLSDALSREIGARYGVSTGDVAAVVLPKVMAFLLPSTPERQARIAAALGIAESGRAENDLALEAPPAVFELMRAWGRPESLSQLGVKEADLAELAGGREDIVSILRQSL